MQPPVNGFIIPGPHYPYAEPHYGYAHPGTVPPIYGTPGAAPYAYPAVYPSGMYLGDASANAKGYWTYATAPAPQVEYYLRDAGRPPLYPPPMPVPTVSSRPGSQSRTPELRVNDPPRVSLPFPDDQAHSPSSGERAGEMSHCGQRAPGTKNIVDIAAIESGVDTRTTVMIKNIPNKMSDKDLLNFINRVCPRRIDFMYLRMDFQNGASP